VTPLNLSDPTTVEAMERVYAGLQAAGFDVLLDDRDLRPGPKFKDAELIGVPMRVTLGERNLKDGNCEIFYRLEDKTDVTPLGEVVGRVTEYYRR
jgi:prolyl-tRNA synthetase